MILFLALIICQVFGDPKVATVVIENKKFVVKPGVYDLTIGVAVGKYDDDRNVDGYEKLEIESNGTYTDEQQMHSAGMLEGYLTQDSILEVWKNYLAFWKWPTIEDMPKNVSDFMKANMEYTYEVAYMYQETDPFYRQIYLMLLQLDGVVAGADRINLNFGNFFLLNSAGDLYGVLEKFLPSKSTIRPVNKLGCSSLIKPTDDDLYFSHVTWRGFQIMNKFYKKYTFPLSATVAKTIAFTSSPGFLTSKEDYYLMDSGIAVTETTNGIYNLTLYDSVVSKSLLYWPRVTAANRLSKTGLDWMNNVKIEASGTYTNQWIVVDYNKWTTWDEVKENSGLLYIGSEMPTLFEVKDVSEYLIKPSSSNNNNQGFWSSYNVPYFKTIYDISGYEEMYKKHGDSYSYENCPRAKIFKRDSPKCSNLEDIKTIILYNDYKNDELQKGDPANGIASRYDLREKSPAAFGGIDGKVTSSKLMKSLKTWLHGGPTNMNKDTPAFDWKAFPGVVHNGQPEVYKFDWFLI